MNHSCDPNTIVKHKSISIKDVYAFRDIKKGEELTHDYAAGLSIRLIQKLLGKWRSAGVEVKIVEKLSQAIF